MVWFLREVRSKKSNVLDFKSMTCARPKKLSGKKISSLKEKDICSRGYSEVLFEFMCNANTI